MGHGADERIRVRTARRIGSLAVVADGRRLGHDEVADRVAERADQLGRQRRLVVLTGGNDLEFVITYLAARAAGHPIVLSGSDAAAAIVDRYDPDVIVSTDGGNCEIAIRHRQTAHDLHPDLALLMSTSGSTGSPKLVRLSRRNVDANAASIAAYLGLAADDVAITSLPLHYCYGLSVLNAHHAVGGTLVVTGNSVVDPCFWSLMADHRVTNLAGVPHTFELITRAGDDRLRLDSLRFVTVAGGRMDPDRVSQMAALGAEAGWDLFVMYGQTEATARMAYLPPELAAAQPDRVGIAVPGGRFEIRPCPDLDLSEGTGEVVYHGPNVMMGYAESPTDLAAGHQLESLHTGDLGRIDEHGLLEIVGRRNRFAKLFGLRIDLGRIERQLAEHNVVATCASDDSRLVVAVERLAGSRSRVATTVGLVASLTGLPTRSIEVVECDQLPRLANGKADTAGVLRMAPAVEPIEVDDAASVEECFRQVLGVSAMAPNDTFASLGGDSFSYVEMSIRLEALLGDLPSGWHLMSVAALERTERRRPSRWVARVDTSVLLRALAIVSIVITHMRIARIPAGAHILLAVVGYNFARFQVPRLVTERPNWWRSALSPVAKLAAITSAWTAVQMVLWGGYGWTTLLLVNNYLGAPEHVDGRWRYWFFEAIVVIMATVIAVLGVAPVRRLAQRRPLVLPMLLLIPAGVFRFEVLRLVDRDYNYVYRPDTIIWCFLLGWAAAVAAGWRQRVVVSAAVVLFVQGYFHHQVDRETRLVIAALLLVWVPSVLVPRLLATPIGWVASASMWIFMTHWIVWPELTPWMPKQLAVAGTVAAGVVMWATWRWATAAWPTEWLKSRRTIRHAEQFRMVERPAL